MKAEGGLSECRGGGMVVFTADVSGEMMEPSGFVAHTWRSYRISSF